MDLVTPHAVLGYAPASGAGSMFMTPGMRGVDQVLSHMDNPNWDVKKYTTLERMVHVMHMNEVRTSSRESKVKVMNFFTDVGNGQALL